MQNTTAPTGHSKLGASSTKRWFNCPGSVKLIEAMGEGAVKSSTYADDGTLAHDIAARCLVSGEDAKVHIGEADFATDAVFKEEDAVAVQVYLDHIRGKIDELGLRGSKLGSRVLVEERFHLPDVHPDFYGTTDCTLIGDKQAVVADYKHGAGVMVSAEKNTQLMQYAVGALYGMEAWQDDKFPVEINICQPRVYGVEPVRSWWTTVGDLKGWLRDDWLTAARRTEMDAPFLQPGPWCNSSFCPKRLTCPAIKEMRARVLTYTPEIIKAMEDWELGLAATETNIVKGLAKVFDEEIFTRLRAGKQISGWKMVAKKADRVFKDDAPVADTFGEAAYEKKLKTPPAIEKLEGGKDFVKKYAYKPDTGMTVAPDTDARAGQAVRNRDEVFEGVL
ncbi:MAG: DUF2800 domain-containing protein [Fimbriimonadaceae bacterium]